jgi:hypothetical protein
MQVFEIVIALLLGGAGLAALDRRPGDEEYKLYFGFGNAF